MNQSERVVFASKKTTCVVCPIKDNCPMMDTEGPVCLEMANVVMEVQQRYKRHPKTFSIRGMVDMISRLKAELAVIPRVSERYADIVKLIKEHYVELHKMKYGTKQKVSVAQVKLDVNKLVEQSMTEDEEIVNEKGEVVAVVKRKKKVVE